MVRFLLKRLIAMVVVLFSLAVLVFFLQRAGSADPAHAYVGANASKEAVDAAREHLGLNDPLPAQFVRYLTDLFHGDLGTSYSTKRSVASDLSTRFPATIELTLGALLFAVVVSVLLAGLYTRRGRGAGVLRFVFLSAASAPAFLLATAGLLVLYRQLGWLPAGGRSSFGPPGGPTGMYVLDGLIAGDTTYALDALRHLVLPALAASIGPGVALARVLADGLVAGMSSSYARTARSLGETERSVLFRHALRNASSPAVSLFGVQAGMMLSSLVVMEQIFSWNGLGQYLSKAIGSSDYPVVAAVSLALGACYVLINTAVDIALASIDPRVRLS